MKTVKMVLGCLFLVATFTGGCSQGSAAPKLPVNTEFPPQSDEIIAYSLWPEIVPYKTAYAPPPDGPQNITLIVPANLTVYPTIKEGDGFSGGNVNGDGFIRFLPSRIATASYADMRHVYAMFSIKYPDFDATTPNPFSLQATVSIPSADTPHEPGTLYINHQDESVTRPVAE